MSGCVTTSGPNNKIITDLPQVGSIKTISDMTQIAFEWERANDEGVQGYYLYRNDALNTGDFKKVATIKDRYATHYVDTNLKPATAYQYTMSVYSKNGEGQMGQVYTVYTQNVISSVEFSQVLGDLAGRAKILWKPHNDARVASYIIERAEQGSDDWKKIAELKGRLNVAYIDDDVKPGHSYAYRIRVKTYEGVISEPNIAQAGTTKALPNAVEGLSASTDQPKKIVLNWQANTSEEFAHYVIYSASSTYLPFTKLAISHINNYEDYINDNGKTRYYKVTSVDKFGQESPKPDDSVQGSTLPAPNAPSILDASFNGLQINLAWSSEDRAVRYALIKSSKFGSYRIDTAGTTYTDSDLQNGVEYQYSIIAIDEYGLESKESKKAIVKTEITIQ